MDFIIIAEEVLQRSTVGELLHGLDAPNQSNSISDAPLQPSLREVGSEAALYNDNFVKIRLILKLA